ncbi:MAG: isocitrate lyase, partial [Pseudobdellovibrionaceae bacterium]
MSTAAMTEIQLEEMWSTAPRWRGVRRNYKAQEVLKLKTSLPIEYSIARHGAEKLWSLMNQTPYVNT